MPSDHVVWQWRSPRICAELDERRRRIARRASLAQLRRDEREPERGEDARLVGGVGQRLRARRRTRPSRSRARARSRTRPARRRRARPERPSTVMPVSGDEQRDDLRQRGEARPHRRPGRRSRPRRPRAGSSCRTSAAGRPPATPPSAVATCADERPAPVEQQRTRGAASPRSERGQDPSLGLRPDAAHLAQPARRSSLAELGGGVDARARGRSRWRARRVEPDHPAERGQLQRDRLPQLAQLGELPGLDELAQPPLDSRPDSPQLTHAPGADELGDRTRRAAHELGRPTVRPPLVVLRPGQLEQRRVLVELRGDRRVAGIRERAGRARKDRRCVSRDERAANEIPLRVRGARRPSGQTHGRVRRPAGPAGWPTSSETSGASTK